MEDCERRIIEAEQRSKSNTHRIDKLEENNTALQKLATSVELMAQSMEGMHVELAEQGDRLDTLERQPAERWNNLTKTIFTAAVSTLSGGLVGAAVTLLAR